MAGVTLGFLKYVLGFDSIAFRKGISQADADLAKMQKAFVRKGKDFQKLGKDLSTFVTLPLAGIAAAGIKEAMETQAAMAQVNAGLKSMGPVAGRSAKQLQDFANALEGKSLFEADQILRDVTATMLTFGNVTGTTFDRAQQAAVDLATKFQLGPKEAAIQLGKALNDPIKGITALGRTGIQFSEQQKAVIKSLVDTGQTAKAQSIILGEVEKQIGGSAAAAQDADPFNKLSDAFKNMAETLAGSIMPILPAVTDAISGVLNAFASLPQPVQTGIVAFAAVAAAIGPVMIGLGSLIKIIALSGPAVTALATGWKALQAGFLIVRIAALETLPALLPYLIPLGAIALAVGAVYLAWKNWDKITAFVRAVYVGVKTWLQDKLNAVWDWVEKKIGAVIGFFKNLWDKVVGNSYVPDMVAAIGQEMAKLDALMVDPAQAATSKTAQAFADLQGRVQGILQRLFPEQSAGNAFLQDLKDLRDYAAAAKLPVDELNEAIRRLTAEHFGGTTEPDFGDTSPLTGAVDFDAIERMADGLLAKFPQLVEQSKQWRDVIGQVGMDLSQMAGNWLSGLVSGTVKLKDLWKDLLSYAIRFFTSSNSPFMSLFGGARASGGPVLPGSAYLVGEQGPEIFMPPGAGRIISNGDSRRMLASGHGGTIMNIYTPDANSFHRSGRQIARDWQRRMART
jgi:hypothetical protein